MKTTKLVGTDASSTIKFAIRYLGRDPRGGKDLTPTESKALKAAGMGRVVVYQPRRAFVPTSADNGRLAASQAHGDAVACGMPPTRPIYFSVDGDTRGFTAAKWAPIEEFFREVQSWLTVGRTGVYGGKNTVEHLFNKKLVTWKWQTYAWSGGQWADVHIRQYDNENPLCGGAVDFNRSMKKDYGQW
jgi:hypothetical protein